jgi:hypothetical protein
VGGIEGASADWGVCVDEDTRSDNNGALLVGPVFTKDVMSSGVLAGVTLSMNCQAGRRRTMELWSEWLGTGMSEAESISF